MPAVAGLPGERGDVALCELGAEAVHLGEQGGTLFLGTF